MITVKLVCPHCGTHVYRNIKPQNTYLIELCDCDEGGCDTYYVTSVEVSYTTKAFTLKEIENASTTT